MADKSAALATEKEARDVAESARESEWSGPSFVRELFLGRFRLDLIHPRLTSLAVSVPAIRSGVNRLTPGEP